MVGVVTVNWFKFAWLVGLSIEDRCLDGGIFKILHHFLLLKLGLGRRLSAFGTGGKIEILVIFDVFQFSFAFVLLKFDAVCAHHLHFATKLRKQYMVSFSIFSA